MMYTLTQKELIALAEELLDDDSRKTYGKNTLLIFANALGIPATSAVKVNSDGEPIYQFVDYDYSARLKFVRHKKASTRVSFAEAMADYDRQHPPRDPLSEFDYLTRKNNPRPRNKF